jgi:hypothetical protein
VSLRGVLDEREPPTIGDLLQTREVGRLAVEADRHDRLRPRRDRRLHLPDVDREVVLADVDEDRARSRVEDAVGAGDERERHRDHLVARTDVVAEQCEVQCGGARAGRDGIRHADHRGEGGFELGDARSLGERAGGHRLPDALLLLLAHLWASDWDHSDRLL